MENKKIILSADSPCDLGEDLCKKHNVQCIPLHITLDGGEYRDGVDITPETIFKIYSQKKLLPKTAAISAWEYQNFFKSFLDKGYEVVHINLSSALSCSYQNCCTATKSLEGVYNIDSKNLCTGVSLLVLKAAEMTNAGMPASSIADKLRQLTAKVRTSFILNTLEFLYAGGRCSALSAMGANILGLKPCIEVDSLTGTMGVGKKYRGNFQKAALQYINDQLSSADKIKPDNLFLAYSAGTPQECVEEIYKSIKMMKIFKNIYVNKAGCTISAHCGPNTIGLMFMEYGDE